MVFAENPVAGRCSQNLGQKRGMFCWKVKRKEVRKGEVSKHHSGSWLTKTRCSFLGSKKSTLDMRQASVWELCGPASLWACTQWARKDSQQDFGPGSYSSCCKNDAKKTRWEIDREVLSFTSLWLPCRCRQWLPIAPRVMWSKGPWLILMNEDRRGLFRLGPVSCCLTGTVCSTFVTSPNGPKKPQRWRWP